MGAVLKFAQARSASPTIEQIALKEVLRNISPNYLKKVKEEYRKRRDILVEGLKKIEGVELHTPEGAFYSIIGLPINNSEKFAKWLLTDFSHQNETVFVAPAAGFYATPGKGNNEVRLAYIIEQKNLLRALDLLKIAI